MKTYLIHLLIFLVTGYAASAQDTLSLPQVEYNPIAPGETIEYKVTFGFFTVGKAQIQTSPKLYKVNGRACYKVDVRGKTSGAVDWVASVDDTWGAYMDTLTFLPHLGYRNIKENNYRKNELTKFDQRNLLVELKVLDQKTRQFKESNIFKTEAPVRDIVSGYSFLRTIDYRNYQKGDTIALYGVFEDEIYDFKILYEGEEVLKTKLGELKVFKLVPVMPNNQLFSGENAISIWLSDDAYKVPVKIEASMVIGKAGCEIISYSTPEKETHPVLDSSLK